MHAVNNFTTIRTKHKKTKKKIKSPLAAVGKQCTGMVLTMVLEDDVHYT